MIIEEIKKFCDAIERGKKLLAIDYGQKKIGLAISDPLFNMALPYKILQSQSSEHKISSITKELAQGEFSGIIIGLPINMDGTRTPQSELIEKFASSLAEKTDLPILLQDERLTTKAADNLLKDIGLKRAQRNERDDSVAASLILETVLNYYQKSFN